MASYYQRSKPIPERSSTSSGTTTDYGAITEPSSSSSSSSRDRGMSSGRDKEEANGGAVGRDGQGVARDVASKKKVKEEMGSWGGLGRFNPTLVLDNKGSVARDHLANERTYLAWLRTSLSLASIGVAITQLFRLNSALYTYDPNPPSTTSTPTSSTSVPPSTTSSSSSPTASLSLQDQLNYLLTQMENQRADLEYLSAQVAREREQYHHLGKPIGGTFIIIGLVFLLLGTLRYFRVQNALTKDKYPPSRRSVIMGSFMVGAIVIAGFAAILAFQSQTPTTS